MNDVSPADEATSPALPPRFAPQFADREVAALKDELAATRRDLELALRDLRVLRGEAEGHVAGLTPRQREVMVWVLAGHPSKNIAADLGISCRSVENHRASIMRRTGARSLPGLTKLALAAGTLA
jgi:two-component system CheB/CheR fusion protein